MVVKSVCFFVVFNLVLFSLSGVVAAERVGTADYGYVNKEVYGNLDSNVTVVAMTGMHPLESGSHEAMAIKLKTMPTNSNKRYIHYSIHVTKKPYDYNIGRMNGQLLAQKFIVPDVDQYSPVLVVDIHENRWKDSGYKYGRFLYLINPTRLTYYYADNIIKEISFLVKYTPPNPTSPPYMAIPLAQKGIPMIIYENYLYDSQNTKNMHMEQFINTLDTIKPAPENITTTKNTHVN